MSRQVRDSCFREISLLLQSPLLGDVSGDLRRTHDPAFGIFDRRDGQRNHNQSAILALANRFIMFDMLSASNTLKNDTFLFASVCRNQNRDRSADRLFCGIAEHSLCAPVPTCNDAIQSLAYDRVMTGLDNGS